jgi:uncharacterized surface protein with fasciclin (FAS1) repeats
VDLNGQLFENGDTVNVTVINNCIINGHSYTLNVPDPVTVFVDSNGTTFLSFNAQTVPSLNTYCEIEFLQGP